MPGPEWTTPGDNGTSDQNARQALTLMLEEATDVLKTLGLHSRPGFYRWDPHRMEWAFLSSAMTPAERWAMVLEAPTGEGWRYATLPQVTRREMPEDDAVRQAAEVIEQATACLNAADQAGARDLESVVKLAVAWAEFQVARIVPNSERREPLRLYFPPEDNETPVPLAKARTARTKRRARKSGADA